jgi:hypothetical protein
VKNAADSAAAAEASAEAVADSAAAAEDSAAAAADTAIVSRAVKPVGDPR